MRKILVALAVATLAADAGVAAEIKSTTKLILAADGSDSRINEVTDDQVLKLSHVYAGTFIGEPAEPPSVSLPRYTITFDIQTREGIKIAGYVVQYAVDAAAGQAFVYLPGRGDAPYRRNISTILREKQDGRWHRASAEWSNALHPHLP